MTYKRIPAQGVAGDAAAAVALAVPQFAVIFSNGSTFASDVINFYWNVSNKRLRVLPAANTTALDVGGAAFINGKPGFYGSTPAQQYSTPGTTAGFTSNSGSKVYAESIFTGGTPGGGQNYSIGDIVRCFKLLGWLAM